MRTRLLGAGVAAVGLVALLAGPALAETTTVAVTGPPTGVEAHCPEGMQPSNWTVTNGDGTPLAPDQRWHAGPTADGGIAAWIAPYLNSPPPPESITLTLVCTC